MQAIPHFLILGAGIMGATLAHRLTTLGQRVTILDAAQPASAASGASFGWVNASFFLSEPHFHLRHAAMQAHVRLASELGRPATPQGCLWYEEEGDEFDRTHSTLANLGYLHRLLTRADIAALEPALATPPDRALLFPTESAIDTAALTHNLLAKASAHGASLITGLTATALTTAGDRITGALTPTGPITADHTILATGTGTPALLAALGMTFPMLHRPGAIFRSQPVPPLLHHILATPQQEVRQTPDGALIAPAAAQHQSESSDTPPDPREAIDATLHRLRTLFPKVDIRPAGISLANRPVPGDGLPAIGPVLPGLSMAVMHSGVTLAPLAAELLAAELTGQGDHPLLAPFRPARFFG
jgi:glycine/D-amino acid oxidase-like deaminating enzyme